MEGNGRPVLVLTALDLEYDAVRGHVRGWRRMAHPSGTWFESATLGSIGQPVVIGRTGVGNQAAAIVAERAIAHVRPMAVLFVGVAGALHDDLRLGDVVVATKVYGYHGGKESEEGFRPRPEAWPAPYEWEQLARQVVGTGRWTDLLPPGDGAGPVVHFRPIAAGEVVLSSRLGAVAQLLADGYDDAAAVEMESAGAARAGHLNRSLPVLTVRGISDRADGAKQAADRAGWQHVAAANAAAFAMALLSEMDAADGLRPEQPAARPPTTGQVTNTMTGTVGGHLVQTGVVFGGLSLGNVGTPPGVHPGRESDSLAGPTQW